MQPAPPTVLAASRTPVIVWPAVALVVAAVSFALPLVRSTWWMNPDNYALLAWGRQVASFHRITLENGLTTPHPLPMALGAGSVTILRDGNNDGTPETRSTYAQGLSGVFGMALHDGYLYLGRTDSVVRYKYAHGDSEAKGTPEKLVDMPTSKRLRSESSRCSASSRAARVVSMRFAFISIFQPASRICWMARDSALFSRWADCDRSSCARA